MGREKVISPPFFIISTILFYFPTDFTDRSDFYTQSSVKCEICRKLFLKQNFILFSQFLKVFNFIIPVK